MGTVFVPAVGEKLFLSNYLSSNNVTIRLVQVNWTSAPFASDTVSAGVLLNISGASTFTITECNVSPYAAQTLSSLSWTYTPAYNSVIAQPQTASYQQTLTFSLGSAGTIYGYYIHTSGNILTWEQMLSSSITVGSGGGTITIVPQITAT